MKSIVIRLQGIEESEKLAKDCIDSGKKNDLIIYPFDGVYGEENIENKHKEFDIRPWKPKMKKGRLGVKGCFLSHYSIWLHSIEINQPIAVFEHDAVILRKIPENITESFDEFLMLDPFNKMQKEYGSLHQVDHEFSIEEYFNENSQQKYGLKYQYAMGLQAYIIKPNAAVKLRDAVKADGYYPADMQCHKGILNIQTVYPSIASINPRFYGNKKLMKEESTTQKKW